MSIIKKGACPSSKVTVSSTVYVCNSCGHTEMVKDATGKKCPKCHAMMTIVSSSCGTESSDEETSGTV